MAKLEGVKVLDMEDGYVKRIRYGESEYVFTEEKAIVGDIVRNKSNRKDARAGNYYEVFSHRKFGKTVVDDSGTSHSNILYDCDVFRKVEAPRIPKPGDKIRIIAPEITRGWYGKGDILTVKEYLPDDQSTHEGVHVEEFDHFIFVDEFEIIEESDATDARLSDLESRADDVEKRVDALEKGEDTSELKTVKRHAKVGERILITDAVFTEGEYGNGDVLVVESMRDHPDRSMRGVSAEEVESVYIHHDEYEVIVEEEEAEKPKLKVGDYAKVVGETIFGDIDEGTFVKVMKSIDDDGDYQIDLIIGSDYDYAKPESLEKVELSDGDLAFIKIGREPGEYKTGDIVRVTENDAWGSRNLENDIGIITRVRGEGLKYFVHVPARGANDNFVNGRGAWHDDKTLELIAPASTRVDIDAE